MTLTVITSPTAEPITEAQFIQHLRLDDITGQELIVPGIIQAVRERAEAVTWRAIMPQTLCLTIDDFPVYGSGITIPRPPLVSVSSIAYSDNSGAMQTLDPSAYQVDCKSEPARIFPVPNSTWPATMENGLGNVVITFTAGYTFPAYSELTAYPAGARVRYQGASYQAKSVTVAGTLPTVTVSWDVIADAEAVPACVKSWMLLNAASLFEHRETTVVGIRAQMVDLDTIVDALLEPVKVRWF